MQCRSFSAQLGRHDLDFKTANTQVLVILGEDVDRARKYAEELKLPFPVLADSERQVYHRYGLHKALIMIQRSAAVIIDQQGIIQFVKAVTNPMTWLSDYQEFYQAAMKSNTATSK